MNPFGPFAHRWNRDKSIDSICTACFQTIASEYLENKLIAHEERHVCNPHWQFSRARYEYRESVPARPSQPVCHGPIRASFAWRGFLR